MKNNSDNHIIYCIILIDLTMTLSKLCTIISLKCVHHHHNHHYNSVSESTKSFRPIPKRRDRCFIFVECVNIKS